MKFCYETQTFSDEVNPLTIEVQHRALLVKRLIIRNTTVSSGAIILDISPIHDRHSLFDRASVPTLLNFVCTEDTVSFAYGGLEVRVTADLNMTLGATGQPDAPRGYIRRYPTPITLDVSSPKDIQIGGFFQKALVKANSIMIHRDFQCEKFTLTASVLSSVAGCKIDCKETVWQLPTEKTGKIFILQDYQTAGKFYILESSGIDEKAAQARLLPLFDAPIASAYTIDCIGTVQADAGMTALTPSARFHLIEPTGGKARLLAKNGIVALYANEIDAEQGGIAAQNARLWGPKTLKIGRLIIDPTRKEFSTFFAHAHTNAWHHMGSGIVPLSYTIFDQKLLPKHRSVYLHYVTATDFTILGQPFYDFYDGVHLLMMPHAMTNGAFLKIDEKIELKGPWQHYGDLEAKCLSVITTQPARLEASTVHVTDADLTGEFHLQPATSQLEFRHVSHPCYGCNEIRTYQFRNSEPASLQIDGQLNGQAKIINLGSNYHAHLQAPEVAVEEQPWKSSLYQLTIAGEEEWFRVTHTQCTIYEAKALPIPVTPNCVWGAGSNYQRMIEYGGQLRINHNGQYFQQKGWGIGFLKATHSFKDSQKIFPAATSFTEDAIIHTTDTSLCGMLAGSRLFFILGNGRFALGSSNRAVLPQQSSFCDSMSSQFNPNTTYLTQDIHHLLGDARIPAPIFMMRELFGFKEDQAFAFYRAIADHVVVVSHEGSFKRAEMNSVFSLSPQYLIKTIFQQVQKRLYRGFIYPREDINETMVQNLHRNTTDYLRTFPAARVEITQKDAAVLSPPSEKPLLFYRALRNDAGVEVLCSITYIPPILIQEVEQANGELVKTQALIILPEHVHPRNLLAQLESSQPQLHAEFEDIFASNPDMTRALTQRADELALVPTTPHKSQVAIHGTVHTGTLGILADEAVTITGDIEADGDALIASLIGDVHIKSYAERHYFLGGFQDRLVRARVAAKKILAILAGRHVIFEAAATDSGLGTEVQALAEILDMPVGLVWQRVHQFDDGFIAETAHTQDVSTHRSKRDINMKAGGHALLCAPEFTANKLSIHSQKSATVETVTDSYHMVAQRNSEKSTWYGGSYTVREQAEMRRTTSRGAIFNVQELAIQGNTGVQLRQITSTAATNRFISEAPVALLQGVDTYQSMRMRQTSSLLWQTASIEQMQAVIHRPSYITGKIVIEAQRITIEQVEGVLLSFVSQITTDGEIQFVKLMDFYHREVQRIEGPSPALSALVSIAVAIVTQGAGSALLPAASETAQVILQAAITSVSTHMAQGLVISIRDPDSGLAYLVSRKTLGAIGTDILAALAMHKFAPKLPKGAHATFKHHLQTKLIKAGIDSTLEVTIQQRRADEALRSHLFEAAVNTLAHTSISKIGEMQPDFFVHKLLHGLVAGATGYAFGGRRAIIPAAMSAMAAETLAEYFLDNGASIQGAINLSRLITATALLFAGQDVALGDRVAMQALEHNFAQSAERAQLKRLEDDCLEKERTALSRDEKTKNEVLLYAQLARDAYFGHDGSITDQNPPAEYRPIESFVMHTALSDTAAKQQGQISLGMHPSSIELYDARPPWRAVLYQNKKTQEYVLSFRGTNHHAVRLRDWPSTVINGDTSKSENLFLRHIKKSIETKYPDARFEAVIGHSEGAVMGCELARALEAKFVGFCAPSLRGIINHCSPEQRQRITLIQSKDDFVSNLNKDRLLVNVETIQTEGANAHSISNIIHVLRAKRRDTKLMPGGAPMHTGSYVSPGFFTPVSRPHEQEDTTRKFRRESITNDIDWSYDSQMPH